MKKYTAMNEKERPRNCACPPHPISLKRGIENENVSDPKIFEI